MKTENLAIILTDIVGYTEATFRLSRKEQKELLHLHNQLLFPIIRTYRGRVVKTIGDALLLAFRSPTDAMICSMAMQDALYDYNRTSSDNNQLHIRIAASLGEVRIARNDVFGEAVNLTSRIESITPEDEIYLSEAVYLAMNKAEVPCIEVGLQQLKGITEPVRIWKIPRFTRVRLVPETEGAEESALSFPYGGAHLDSITRAGSGASRKLSLKAMGAAVALVGVVAAGYLLLRPSNDMVAPLDVATTSTLTVTEPPLSTPATPTADQKNDPPPVATPLAAAPVVTATVTPPQPSRQVSKPAPAVYRYADLLEQLASGRGADMRLAARRIAQEKISDQRLFAEIVKGLQKHYQSNTDDRVMIDALAWYCRILGDFGTADHVLILEQVAEKASNSKLRRYANRSLAQLRNRN